MNCSINHGVRQLRWQHLFACSFNMFYIYPAFILLFHNALHPPSRSLSFCPSVSLSVVPHPVFLISGLSLRFGDVGVSFLQSQILCR